MAGPPPLPMQEKTVLAGRFKLLAHLGNGGSSEEFLAEQVGKDRKVRVKVLSKDFRGDSEMMARFRRQAELLSSVDHPAVVKVVDFGADRDGTILVTENVEGEPMDALLRNGPMEPRRAVNLFTQIAHGLAALHFKGIVHRDIRSENVIIQESLLGEKAKLTEFGIARMFDPEMTDTAAKAFVTSITDVQSIGTPAYLSPEQARGEPAGPRSDVYSFGVLAYLMLTGQLPFTGDADEQLRHHLQSKPRGLEQVRPELKKHPELCKLVMRCLEKNPVDRFPDGSALAHAIDQIDSAGLPDRPQMVLEREGRGFFGTLMLLVVSLLLAGAPAIIAERPLQHATWAKWLVKAGRPSLALEVLGDGPQEPRWVATKAMALHALKRDSEIDALRAHYCLALENYAAEYGLPAGNGCP